jgi:hypothetical protein
MQVYSVLRGKLKIELISLAQFNALSKNEIKKLNSDSEEFGIILEINENNNPLIKILSLIRTKLDLNMCSKKLLKSSLNCKSTIGVFPDVYNPTAIYCVGTLAETYAHENILPAFPAGINGNIRKLVMKLVKFHPSIGGLVLIVRKH